MDSPRDAQLLSMQHRVRSRSTGDHVEHHEEGSSHVLTHRDSIARIASIGRHDPPCSAALSSVIPVTISSS